MSRRDDTMNGTDDREGDLGAALRALPAMQPVPDLWPDLSLALARRRPRPGWRIALPAALAAALAVFVLLPRPPVLSHRPAPTVGGAPVTTVPAVASAAATTSASADPAANDDGGSELARLHERSQSLERWVAAFAANAPQNGRDLMAAVEVEDLIGLIDVQLGATHGDSEALPLWRQRVALLEDLATIRGSAYAVAANDDGGARPRVGASPLWN